MKNKTFPQDKKAPVFHTQALESMDDPCVFEGGTPRRLTCFEFIWIRKGMGTLSVDSRDHPLQENAIYCLSPGQCRTVRATQSLEGVYISLSAEFYFTVKGEIDYFFLREQFSSGKNSMLLMPETESFSELSDITRLMRREYDRNALSRPDILIGLLRMFLLYLSKFLSVDDCRRRLDDKTEKVMQFLTLVKKDFATKKMVADYAGELALSPAYLNYIVKKISGFNASYHIQQCIILEAKRQIITGNVTLKELTFSLGFTDCSHFSRFFKSRCGINFSSFRKDAAKAY